MNNISEIASFFLMLLTIVHIQKTVEAIIFVVLFLCDAERRKLLWIYCLFLLMSPFEASEKKEEEPQKKVRDLLFW